MVMVSEEERVMTTMQARDKRINGFDNAVFDIWRTDDRGFDHFIATVELRDTAPCGMKVLLGAMQPIGKERAWDAIRLYEASSELPRR
jgi:hypothetical protein